LDFGPIRADFSAPVEAGGKDSFPALFWPSPCSSPPDCHRLGPPGKSAPVTGRRSTVVETGGHNLIVIDNQQETTYSYPMDKGAGTGTGRQRRGQVNGNLAGKEVIETKNEHPGKE
jgi:hypothetical protein